LDVAVHQVDRERLAGPDHRSGLGEDRFRRVAEHALPEAEVTAGDVEVAGETVEVAVVGMLGVVDEPVDVELPPV
jgi:hypothetical protein